jgi:hypothetical protein
MRKFDDRLMAFCSALALALSGATMLHAQNATEGGESGPAIADKPTADLIADYSVFAGSEDNAEALVNGLRLGEPAVLVSGGGETTIDVVTEPMGYGNIKIALALAEQELARQGITEPTPGQIAIALNGGTIDTVDGSVDYPGILTLRAEGRGWGEIANSLGFRLGEVMRSKRPDNAKPERNLQPVERASRRDALARVERPVRIERPEKPLRPERPQRPERAGR